MKKGNKQSGRIRWIIIIIIGLVIASYYSNFSVKDVVENEQTQENYHYIKDQTQEIYDEHLSSRIIYFWNEIFIKLLWSSFVENMERIKAGEQILPAENAPYVPGSSNNIQKASTFQIEKNEMDNIKKYNTEDIEIRDSEY